MFGPFWKTTSVIFRYKRLLAVAAVGALVSALCFGGGIATVLPVLQALLKGKNPIRDFVIAQVARPETPEALRQVGSVLVERLPTDPFYAFLLVLAILIALTVIGSVGRYVHELLTLTAVARVVLVWRSRIFKRLIHAQYAYILTTGVSDPISRILADVRTVGRGLYAMLGKVLAKLLNGAVAVGVALWLDWRLTLIALVAAPFTTKLLRKFSNTIRRASKRLLRQRARMLGMLHESLDNLRVVKVHNAEGYERRRFGRINRELYNEEMSLRQVRAISGPVIETLGLFGMTAAAGFAAWYIFRQGVAPERFMAVLVALSSAAASLRPLSTLNNQVSEAYAAAERIVQVMGTPIEPDREQRHRHLPRLARHAHEVRFEDLYFTYPSADTPALRGVSLTVPHGQTVAIVGPNGSGKTTLLSLLPRIIEPASGRVTIDGVDIAGVRLRSLRRQLAVVSQKTVLFGGTIAENIAYGRRHVPMDKIVAAAEAAHADEFIRTLPDGYEAMLGEGGSGLSGGQAQRLCIARAILREPSILVLDEATSQVDADSEAKINQAVRQLRHGRTTFIIAHRLSTVIDADHIVVMDAGRIVGQGVHADLLDSCALYQTLTHTQLQPGSTRQANAVVTATGSTPQAIRS